MTPLPRSVCQLLFIIQLCQLFHKLHFQKRWRKRAGGAADSPRFTRSTHTHDVLWPFFQDHPSEPVPEESLWAFMVQLKITEADTPIVQVGATPSRLIMDPPPSSLHFYAGCLLAITLPLYPGLAWFGSSGTRPLNRAVCVCSTAVVLGEC